MLSSVPGTKFFAGMSRVGLLLWDRWGTRGTRRCVFLSFRLENIHVYGDSNKGPTLISSEEPVAELRALRPRSQS
jgi:hypothetical protein